MDEQKLAEKVVHKMMADDKFSQWLGIDIVTITPGFARIRMEVRPEMVNGFTVCHGGITFSLGDSALAFASNSYGRVALALENNISFTRKVTVGDILTAVTEEVSLGNRIGVYNIKITNQNDDTVGFFKGTVFRTKEKHLES